jgi:hypothetical protein
MQLFIAGINHYDPMGRERVAAWLSSLVAQHDDKPSFLAVEFDKKNFDVLRQYRNQYRKWIHTQWPEIPPADLHRYEKSLGYEGDVHEVCLPDIDVIWLDAGRTVDTELVDNHARCRLQSLHYLRQTNSLMLPGVVSEQVGGLTRPEVFDPARSRRFADRILEHIRTKNSDWGIAIVGASHASESFTNSMRSLLEQAGLSCKTRIFCHLPTPKPSVAESLVV